MQRQKQQPSGNDSQDVLVWYTQRLRQGVWFQKVTLGAGILFLGGIFYFFAQAKYGESRFVNLFMTFWLVVIVLCLSLGVLRVLRRSLIDQTLRELQEKQLLASAEWPQTLPTLIGLMEQIGGWPSNDELWLWWWQKSQPILVRWLPRLQPGELGSNECRTLRTLLRFNQLYEGLQVAILLALGTARDEKARRIANQLFRRTPHERVREAALECLRAVDN